ncbi:class II fructose-bisphosphate aldolase [Candidatus Parcubacteria bacterium]|nr:MAG: class II fructose-bisphosphate aldolase [Candidatus Parcubacteria bacterium]
MKDLKEYINKAGLEGWALPHFNFSNAETLRAIIEAAYDLKSPILVATSEGERKFIGPRQAVALVQAFRDEYGIPIFLNADHTKSWEKTKEAVDLGYDAVLIDASHLNFKENIELTKKVVEYAKKKNQAIIVEGELGLLRGESKIQEYVEVKEEDLTRPEQAEEFVQKTKVDLLAPSVGNVHGVVTKSQQHVRPDLIEKIKNAIGDVGIVLHGASGVLLEEIAEAIEKGVSVIHINTEIRIAFTEGLRKALAEDSKEVVPYKYLGKAKEMTKKAVLEKIKSFGSAGKI